MRHSTLLPILVTTVLLLFSCEEDKVTKTGPEKFSLDKKEVAFTYTGGTVIVGVNTSAEEWSIRENPEDDWFITEQRSSFFKVTAPPWDGNVSRTGTITVFAEGFGERVINVTQYPERAMVPMLYVETEYIEFDPYGICEDNEIIVITNQPSWIYSIRYDSGTDWLNIQKEEYVGVDTHKLNLTVDNYNDGISNRSCVLTISVPGSELPSFDVMIVQTTVPIFKLENDHVQLDYDHEPWTYVNLNITTSMEWSATPSDSWIDIKRWSSIQNSIDVSAKNYHSLPYYPRIGYIYFYSYKEPLEPYVTVIQYGYVEYGTRLPLTESILEGLWVLEGVNVNEWWLLNNFIEFYQLDLEGTFLGWYYEFEKQFPLMVQLKNGRLTIPGYTEISLGYENIIQQVGYFDDENNFTVISGEWTAEYDGMIYFPRKGHVNEQMRQIHIAWFRDSGLGPELISGYYTHLRFSRT